MNQKTLKGIMIATSVITFIWSIVDNTWVPVAANLSIILLTALISDL